jgi:hypothetical protein
MLEVNRNPSRSDVRTFGLVMLLGFGVIAAVLWYQSIKPPDGWWPSAGWGWNGAVTQVIAIVLLALAVLIALECFVSYVIGRLLYVVWMTGAMYLGIGVTTVLLSVLFIILLPLFSLIRLADPLRLRMNPTGSYWEEPTPHEATLERTRRQF